jgi:hypothetical protein
MLCPDNLSKMGLKRSLDNLPYFVFVKHPFCFVIIIIFIINTFLSLCAATLTKKERGEAI